MKKLSTAKKIIISIVSVITMIIAINTLAVLSGITLISITTTRYIDIDYSGFYKYFAKQYTFWGIEQYENKTNGHKVLFLPMTHLASKDYFAKVKDYIEKKKDEGYIVFDEGINYSRSTANIKDIECDSIREITYHSRLDTLERKYRKVCGYALLYDIEHEKLEKT